MYAKKEYAKKEAELGVKYIFDIDKLESGDILLTRIPMNLQDSSTWDSHLIQTLTRSSFSSAALYLGDGVCIEAVGSGVARLPLLKAGIRDARNVRVLRMRNGSEWGGRKAAAFGMRYLQRGFCRSALPRTKCSAFQDVRRAAVVSSGLVASAYAEADLALAGTKLPDTIFPSDLLCSALLEDITAVALRSLSAPLQSAFQLDDNTLFERVHHWEVATQLKVLCSYEVRRVLELKANKPSSMRELELLIAENQWRSLDEAVSRCLQWYRYADNYRLKQQRVLGDIAAVKPGVIRLLPTALDDDRLFCGALAVAADLRLLEAERSHWLQQRDYYSELQQRYDGKTFAYMVSLYNKQLALSEPLLQLKLQQNIAYKNEVACRGSRLKTA